MSHRQTDIAALRHNLLAAETSIIDLNRQLTDAIVWKRAPGGLSAELDGVIAARDSMKARLARLDA
jgi:hypothetical protein